MKQGVIVTGASSGIGLATVRLLAEKGYGVVGMARSKKPEVLEKYAQWGAVYSQGDVICAEDRARALKTAQEAFGNVYALVNVAGVAPKVRAEISEMTEESYDTVMNINTKGMMFMTQLVARAMLAQPRGEGLRGAIVNISSMSAYTSSISRGEYCISKAGASMITRLFADRLAGEGIIVNEVRPGIIRTGDDRYRHGEVRRLDRRRALAHCALGRAGGHCQGGTLADRWATRVHHGAVHRRGRRIPHSQAVKRGKGYGYEDSFGWFRRVWRGIRAATVWRGARARKRSRGGRGRSLCGERAAV